MPRRPTLVDVNDARLDIRLPAELKGAIEADAALLGVTAPTYARVILAVATDQAQVFGRLMQVARKTRRVRLDGRRAPEVGS